MSRPISQWELNYYDRQAAINRWARQHLEPRVVEVGKIILYAPADRRRYLRKSPCEDCGAEPLCDIPCQAYLQWYDRRMQAAKAALERGEMGDTR